MHASCPGDLQTLTPSLFDSFSTILGGLFGAVGLLFLRWTGIQSSFILPAIAAAGGNVQAGLAQGIANLQAGVAIFIFCAGAPVLLLLIASLKSTVQIAAGSFLILVTIVLLGIAGLNYPSELLVKAAGGINCVVGANLMYTAMAVIMQELGVHVPVFVLPRNEDTI